MPTLSDLRVGTRDALDAREACVISRATTLELARAADACVNALVEGHVPPVAATLEVLEAAIEVVRQAVPPPPGSRLHLVVDELRAA